VNKTSIKIIKRKDAELMEDDKTQHLSESRLAVEMSREKIERRLHRKMADTVSNWITECRKNNRAEEVPTFRKLFGDEFLPSRTA
jgi:glutaredoxin 2